MANNFRLTGNAFVSKDGNDADDGLTPDTAKATPYNFIGSALIIGSGVYEGTNSTAWAGNSPAKRSVKFDGFAVYKQTADLLIYNTIAGGAVYLNDNAEYPLFIEMNNFRIILGSSASVANTRIKYAIIDNCDSIFRGFAATVLEADRVVFINGDCDTSPNADVYLSLNKSQVRSMTMRNIAAFFAQNKFIDSYFDESAIIRFSGGYFSDPTIQFKNCCFRGRFVISGNTYELKRNKAGEAINPNPTYLDILVLDATVYDRGNFSQDAEFLNDSKNDYFTVSNTSPLLFSASDGTNIGGVKSAPILIAGTDFALLSDVVLDSGDYVYDVPSGAGFGTVSFAPKQIAPITQILQDAIISQLLEFNSLEVIGSAKNKNVAILDNYTAGLAGANPRRMTYEMRWSVQDTMPTVSADYDNNGIVSAGDYSKFEHFQQPLIDTNGVGNGDPLFIPLNAVFITAKWVQIKIIIYEGIG